MTNHKHGTRPQILTGRKIVEDQDRDDERRLALAGTPERASTSGRLLRCRHCASWNVPKGKDERCPVCRQRFDPKPLVGLPRAS